MKSNTKVIISCGACDHIWEVGKGESRACPKCNIPRGGVGFYQTAYGNDPFGKTLSVPGIFYVVHLSKNDEMFIKIGVTNTTLIERLGKIYQGYNVKILHEIKLPTLRECCELENKLLDRQMEYKLKFYEHTECITMGALKKIELDLSIYKVCKYALPDKKNSI